MSKPNIRGRKTGSPLYQLLIRESRRQGALMINPLECENKKCVNKQPLLLGVEVKGKKIFVCDNCYEKLISKKKFRIMEFLRKKLW